MIVFVVYSGGILYMIIVRYKNSEIDFLVFYCFLIDLEEKIFDILVLFSILRLNYVLVIFFFLSKCVMF